MACSMPRDPSAAENLPSKPTPLAPTSFAPCWIPWSMYCSKGIDRLSETYQIDFPFAFDASNGVPGGAHFGGCSYCLTSFFASATPAAGDRLLVALDDVAAPSATSSPVDTASAAIRVVLRFTLPFP